MLALRTFIKACLALIITINLVKVSQAYAVGQSKYGRIEKFPYQVMLIGKQLWRKRILCGGTLLNSRWILTAGHCTMGVTHFDVYLGTKSVDESLESGKVILRSNKFIVHEGFNPHTAAHDIALVKLPEDVKFTTRIKPAILPYRMQNDHFIDARVVATGWGAAGETTNSDPMQYTELKVISNAECSNEFDVITAGILCAKGLKDETVCSGDSGGPLVLKGTPIVVGITSFGPADGCETNIPGGFTRVTHYLNWIDSKIGNSQRAQQTLRPVQYQQQQQQQTQHHSQHYHYQTHPNQNII